MHDEAEVLEHAVSDRMLDRIDAKLGYPTRDPHGDPIPAADGQVPTPPARQLSVCQDGDAGHRRPHLRRRPGDAAVLRHRRDQPGLPAAWSLARRDFAGMISVAVQNPAIASDDDAETTVDLGSPAAEAIWVVA